MCVVSCGALAEVGSVKSFSGNYVDIALRVRESGLCVYVVTLVLLLPYLLLVLMLLMQLLLFRFRLPLFLIRVLVVLLTHMLTLRPESHL